MRTELPRLEDLFRRGMANGVQGLELIGPERLHELEPSVTGIKAIYSPQTGITDFVKVAHAYAHAIQQHDGEIITSCKVKSVCYERQANFSSSAFSLIPIIGTGTIEIEARYVITCGGLQSDKLSQMSGQKSEIRMLPFRGDYYVLRPEKRHKVRALIYPVPDPRFPFLGVHFTRRINGEVWAGPNAVMAFAREGYQRWKINPKDLMEILSYQWILEVGSSILENGISRDVS